MRAMVLTLMVAIFGALGAVSAGAVQSLAEGVQQPPQQQQAPPPAKVELTNINTADSETLQKLPGIGPATAKSIIEYRETHDGFKKVEELMNVKGVGEKTFLKLKDLITVGPPKGLA